MADLMFTKLVIDGKTYAIPEATPAQSGLMTPEMVIKVNVLAEAQKGNLNGIKVNGTALAITNAMVDILVQTGTANGTIKVNGADVSVAGLADLAYKAKVSEADLDTALKAVLDGKLTEAQVQTLLNSAIDEFATKVSDDNVVNTFKEIVDYVAENKAGVADMVADISKLKTDVSGLKTELAKYVTKEELASQFTYEYNSATQTLTLGGFSAKAAGA